MALKINKSKTKQPKKPRIGLTPAEAAAAAATPALGLAAAPLEPEKADIQQARKEPAAKKPGKPDADAQQDSSAAEDGKAMGSSQSGDSVQATDQGMARASLTDNVLSSENSSAADLALPEGSLPTSKPSLESNSLQNASNTSIAPDGANASNIPGAPATPPIAPAAFASTSTTTTTSTSASKAGIGWGVWAGGGAAAVGALALVGGKSSDATPTQLISAVHIQSIGLGPLINGGLKATVYAADGKVISPTVDVGASGQAQITLYTAFSSYSGAAIVKVTGTAIYIDEATGQRKAFSEAANGPMLAALVLSAGQVINVNINPLTTFAAIEAGVQPDGSINSNNARFDAESVKTASNQVARLIGLGDNAGDRLTQTTPVFAVDKNGVQSTDYGADLSSSSDGVKVGTFLAIVSGLENSKGTSTTAVIQELSVTFNSNPNASIENSPVAPLLLQGAGQVSVLGSSVSSYVYAQLKVNSVGIHSNKTQLKVGESATITFTFGGDPGS
ncbi:MAG: hypothetical protein ORN28_04790, partial [Rhodoferax sp.]|nr:hypothetical protein [Rhodoferax sp.]